MKVLLLSTTDTNGGAAVACLRLLKAMRKHGQDVSMLVQHRRQPLIGLHTTSTNVFKKYINLFRFALERYHFSRHEKSQDIRFSFSPANTGENISQHPLVKEADLIHLHWTNFGFLSVQSLQQLFALGKPIVWTMHDMWAFTGGCHYAGGCGNFTSRCQNCPYLKKPDKTDISSVQYKLKKSIYNKKQLTFVGCSNWMAHTAKQSQLLKEFTITSIPNPIDLNIFKPSDKTQSRQKFGLPTDKKLILFGAAKVNDPRKGLKYLAEALESFNTDSTIAANTELVIFGRIKGNMIALPNKTHFLPFLTSEEEVRAAYNAADLFILPSLEDNLPNTIMESMACGTPVVAFNTGGIPQMINHKQNGYIASYKSGKSLAEGIAFILEHEDYTQLATAAREKVEQEFSEEIVVKQYSELYKKLTKK